MSARRPTRSSGATQIPDVLPPSRTLTVRAADGTPLHTQVFGPPHGYPIVLTHGFVCAIRAWAYQIADLAGDYRVIAFDHRGHGRSGVPRRGAYSLNHLAADLDSVLDATLAPRERAVVAGHSMGGITIAAWSDRYRHKVRRRTDAVALINTTTGDLVRKVKLLSVPRELSPVRVLAGRSLVNTFGGFPLPGAARALSRHVISTLAVAADADPSATRLVYELFTQTSAAGRTPISQSRRIARTAPNVVGLVELPGGHCSMLERHQEVNSHLRALAESVTRHVRDRRISS
ncbi:alpha/beta fold hydrolase [Mycobacterium tuberculosis]|uniref:alpha/beta fold hydrolase n=1 Tax=Mycobacterium tuberculosis TaxID=1773 RepID=UPI00091F1037|nr:alpha/beta hydrolase [Mycobacterium tuberculosis]SGP06425.1 alpha/beta fold family hydrolase [Mycobacterium tuberculosis]